MTTSKRLAQLAQTSLILPFLIAALLGLGLRTNAVTHAPAAASSQHLMAVDPPPPSI